MAITTYHDGRYPFIGEDYIIEGGFIKHAVPNFAIPGGSNRRLYTYMHDRELDKWFRVKQTLEDFIANIPHGMALLDTATAREINAGLFG